MNYDIIITIIVIIVTLFLFIKEYFSVDLVAMGVIVSLVSTGVISVEEGLEGFSNEATLTVAAMFVLSNGLIKTQIIEYLSPFLEKLFRKGYVLSVLGLGSFIGVLSSFINNTPVVATFIPIVNSASKKIGVSPSRFLMILSYVSIFGGTCTLIGTSTNLLVSGLATQQGYDGFSMFLMTPLGIILFLAGLIYLILFGRKLIPEYESLDELEKQVGVKRFLTEVKIGHLLENKKETIESVFKKENISVKALKHKKEIIKNPDFSHELKEGDVLLIEGDLSKVRELIKMDYVSMTDSFEDKVFPEEETRLVEIVLFPNSDIVGKKLKNVNFLSRYNSTVIAIRQRGKKQFENLKDIKLKSGDVLVLLTNERGYDLLQDSQKKENAAFLSLREQVVKSVNKTKLSIVILTLTGVVTLASTGVVPVVIAAFGGVIVLNVTGILSMSEAYRSIDWKVIFLLAGSLSIGKAMSSSGLSDLIGNGMLSMIDSYAGPVLLVAVFYIITSILTETMSNNAAAALMVPIAISITNNLELHPTPLLLAVTFAGSASFMTPIGYQTNTMIYGAGNYRFVDFLRVGGPLNLLFWILASLLIPLIYPFQ